ncbi:hypothetical protein EDB19DRAFT_1828339 [Suillus lakei]|nr:hypothetical protein EDB19DRAFT_1828339 [Suillus lakei]
MDDPTQIPYEFHPFYFLGFLDDTEDIDGYKPGADITRYQVLHKLGLGSMSTVWLAKDAVENHSRCVALKIAMADLSSNDCKIRYLTVAEQIGLASIPVMLRLAYLHQEAVVHGMILFQADGGDYKFWKRFAFWGTITDWRPLRHPDTPSITRPPELTSYKLSDSQLKDEWGLPSDFWSTACTIWEIAFSDVMLAQGSEDDSRLIYEAMKLVGPLPERWKPCWNPGHFEDSDGNIMIDPDATWKKRCPTDNDGDATGSVVTVVDLLRDMSCWELMACPTATSLLQHPWFAT